MWKAYASLKEYGFTHRTVNHSKEFKNPITGVHTNNIESLWKDAKQKFKIMCGVDADNIPPYLDEFLWRQYHGREAAGEEAFRAILSQMGELWPWN